MYDFLRGKLVETAVQHAVIEVQGIGYRLSIPHHLLGKLTPGEEHLFFTALVVKEDSHTLFGFQEKKERDLFEKLIEISGIGPKTALNLIGHLPLPVFTNALRISHVPTFTHVPGVGKKTAERLIFELRAKLEWFASLEETASDLLPSQKIGDALSALLNLGFAPTTAKAAVEKAAKELPQECELSTLIAHALRVR